MSEDISTFVHRFQPAMRESLAFQSASGGRVKDKKEAVSVIDRIDGLMVV